MNPLHATVAICLAVSALSVEVHAAEPIRTARSEAFELATVAVPGSDKLIDRVSLAVPADGRPVVAYYEAQRGEIHIAKCRNPRCNGPLGVTRLAGVSQAGAGLAMTLGANGHPLLSYQHEPSQSLQLTACSTADCSQARHAVVDADGAVGQYTSIAQHGDGRVLISYHDAAAPGIRVASCADAACTAPTITRIDWYAAGPHSVVAISPDGTSALAFQDEHGALNYARCDAVDCSGTLQVNMVDGGAAGVGEQPTLRFDAAQRPVLGYRASAGRRIGYAHCRDLACSDVAVRDIDGEGRDGSRVDSPSLTLTVAGLPVLAYRRSTGDLMIAACTDVECNAAKPTAIAGVHAGAPGIAAARGPDGSLLVAYVHSGSGGEQVRVTQAAAR